MQINNVTVLGAGVWGSVIAQHIAQCGFKVCVWEYSKTLLDAITSSGRHHPNIPNFKFHDNITLTGDEVSAVKNADMDCSTPGFPVHGVLQTRILEWGPCPHPGDLPDPGIEPMSPKASALQADSLLLSHWRSPMKCLLLLLLSRFSRVRLCATP